MEHILLHQMKKTAGFLLVLFLISSEIFGQTKPFPNAYPPNGVIGEWGYNNNGTNWDTSPYLAFVYNQQPFRLMPPNGVRYENGTWVFDDPNKKYPVFVFLHGLGERGEAVPYAHPTLGQISNNNRQLLHGGSTFKSAVQSGKFEGFLLYPQTWNGYFAGYNNARIAEVIEKLITDAHIDPDRVIVNGLSAGGTGTWQLTIDYPNLFAAALPMSGVSTIYTESIPSIKHIPIWLTQGGLDKRPSPSTAHFVVDAYRDAGADIKYVEYPNLGHGTWTTTWAEPDFFPYINSKYKNQPLVYFQKNEFCPGEAVSVRLGFTAGFDGYEWRKDGQVIAGANSNEITVTSFGTYEGRFRRGSVWTDWSPYPIVVKLKDPTVTPPILVSGLASAVLPSLDGRTTVTLELPEGFVEYAWKAQGIDEILGNGRLFEAPQPGNYIASVKELYGCSSNWSEPFTVLDANGPNKPDSPGGLFGFALSTSDIKLNWVDNPNSQFNETGYEIFRSLNDGGPYDLIHITQSNAQEYIDANLIPNTMYYYRIRSINQFAASSEYTSTAVLTKVDAVPPTTPLNLRIVSSNFNSIAIAWDPSTDDTGVFKYDIYKNGNKSVVTDLTSASIYNLVANDVYNISVRARDVSGNESPHSNQVTAKASAALSYNYYHGNWTSLPNFSALTPVKTGYAETFNFNDRLQNDYFAYSFTGRVYIPTAGTWTFYTRTDEGSKLYLDGTLLVNNDGLHSARERSGARTLTVGWHDIQVDYFERTGSQTLEVRYQGPGLSKRIIPASALVDQSIPGTPPAFPTGLIALAVSYDQINLTWTDNSEDETGFQVYRADNPAGPFYPIGIAAKEATTFSDKGLAPETTYFYKVMALGKFGESGFSTEIGSTLEYNYYEINNLSVLPNFNNYTPIKSGIIDNFDISVRNRADNFAFVFEGEISIPTDGDYLFFTTSDDGSKLYINGIQVVNNDGLHGSQERSGSVNLTKGRHDIRVEFFERGGGEVLQVRWQGPGIAKQLIPNTVLRDVDINAKTLSLPPQPSIPINVVANAVSSSAIVVSWTDNSQNEDNFHLYRSSGNSDNFIQLSTLPEQDGGTIEYRDENLFTNLTYYYKVVAQNVGGDAESEIVFTKTLNTNPVLSQLPGSLFLNFGSSVVLDLVAEDIDQEPLHFSYQTNVPVNFLNLTDFGNGTGVLTFNPTGADQGSYTLEIKVEDQNGGFDSELIGILVSDNAQPIITQIPDISLKEGESLSVEIEAFDGDDNSGLVWEFANLPAFVEFNHDNNGHGVLSLNPDFATSGMYSNISVKVTDGEGAFDTKYFNISIEEVDLNTKVYANISRTVVAGAPWNNLTAALTTNLLNEHGNQSNVAIQFSPSVWNTWNEGANTGNDSGVFPDNVIRDYYYFGIFSAPATVSIQIQNLVPNKPYNITLFGSSTFGATSNGETIYTINGNSKPLNVEGNSQNAVVFEAINSNESGTIDIGLTKGIGAPAGYLNALVVEALFEDGTVPLSPDNIVLNYNDQIGEISVSWKDVAYNEYGYDVYRKIDDGAFIKLNAQPLPKNTTSYVDNSVVESTNYTYRIVAFNDFGLSENADASILVPNKAPVISTIGNLELFVDESKTVQFSISDLPLNNFTITTSALPAFASLFNQGNGIYSLSFNPEVDNIGDYTINIIATDEDDASTSELINLVVKEKPLFSVLLNLNRVYQGASPWNNTNKVPVNGDTFSNLINTIGANSGISVQLQSGFGGVSAQGASTGNNSGVVPDNVLQEYYWFGAYGAPEKVYFRVNGLDITKKYTFKFIASSVYTDGGIANNGSTVFSIGQKSSSVNVQANTDKLAVIDNVIPIDNNGYVVIEVSKGSDALIGFVNGFIIEAYDGDSNLFNPDNLYATATSSSSINLLWNDNSFNETGYEVYRSVTNSQQDYQLIGVVGSNISAFNDTGLQKDVIYYYKVRAILDGGNYSQYSNEVSSGTISYSVFININGAATYNAAVPWNNLSHFALDGEVISGFKGSDGRSTGLVMRVLKSMLGDNNWGVSSGIYPSNVMKSFYYNNAFDPPAQYNFEGLEQGYKYNFSFLGAIETTENIRTNFTIGNQTVTNNQTYNTNEVVTIYDVVPDENNEVLVQVQETFGSRWAIFNAMVIDVIPTGGTNPNNLRSSSNEILATTDVRFGLSNPTLQIYPNPLNGGDMVNIGLTDGSPGDVTIELLDMQGKAVYMKVFNNLHVNATFDLQLSNIISSRKGLYLLRMSSEDGQVLVGKLVVN